MNRFVEKYLDKSAKLTVIDIGSCDVGGGSYNALFSNANWQYTGCDLASGPNVDIVTKGPYDFGIEQKYDVVISGNCLEHVENPFRWIKEVERITKRGGYLCIITPWSLPEHRFPVDCWRILPDGYKYLLEQHCQYKLLECKINVPPDIGIRFFSKRWYLKWVTYLLPSYLKSKFGIPATQDTYAIAILAS
jgi:SAM-dependent methyltransferase